MIDEGTACGAVAAQLRLRTCDCLSLDDAIDDKRLARRTLQEINARNNKAKPSAKLREACEKRGVRLYG